MTFMLEMSRRRFDSAHLHQLRVSETNNHRQVHILEIMGSTPIPATKSKKIQWFCDFYHIYMVETQNKL